MLQRDSAAGRNFIEQLRREQIDAGTYDTLAMEVWIFLNEVLNATFTVELPVYGPRIAF